MSTSPRAVIYTRVSQDRYGRGRSVEEQEAECLTLCSDNGWRVVEVFTDNDRSASRYATRERPAFDRLIRLLEAGNADVLVAWEASRTTRDLRTFLDLRDLCEHAHILYSYEGTTYDMGDPRDRQRATEDAVKAEGESGRTSFRVQRAVRANAHRGRPHGKFSYGYRREYDPTTRELSAIVENTEQAEVIREAARRVLAGESLFAVSRDLDRLGVPRPGGTAEGHCGTCGRWIALNRNGTIRHHYRRGEPSCVGGGDAPNEIRDGVRRWDPTTLRRLLLNPAYAGKRVHRGAVVGDAAWVPILTEPDHLALTALLTDPARQTSPKGREGAIRHLLSGLATCGVCGGQVNILKARNSVLRYHCKERFCIARKKIDLDDFVCRVVVARLSRPDAVDLLRPAGADTQFTEAVQELRALRARLDGFYDQAADGGLTPAALARIEERLLPQIQAAERRAQHWAIPTVVSEVVGSDDVAGRWETLTLAQKRAVISTLMDVQIMPAVKGSRVFDPAKVRIVWKTDTPPAPLEPPRPPGTFAGRTDPSGVRADPE